MLCLLSPTAQKDHSEALKNYEKELMDVKQTEAWVSAIAWLRGRGNRQYTSHDVYSFIKYICSHIYIYIYIYIYMYIYKPYYY